SIVQFTVIACARSPAACLLAGLTPSAALLFRDLSVDYAAKSVEDIATYYQCAGAGIVMLLSAGRRLTSDIPFPFFDIIFGTQVIMLCYLTGRLIQWRMLLDVLTLGAPPSLHRPSPSAATVCYLTVMLLYIF